MIKKTIHATLVASSLIVPMVAAGVYLPSKPSIIKLENVEFSKHMLLGMPMTMGMLSSQAKSGIVLVGTAISENAATSLTSLTGGSGTAAIAGDLVIVHTCETSGSDHSYSLTGYTVIADQYINTSSLNDPSSGTLYKVMGTTPDTSVALVTNAESQIVTVWRKIHATTPLDVTPTTNSAINTTPSGPNITTITSKAVVINQFVSGYINQTAITPPTGYTMLNSRNGSSHNIFVAYKVVATAGLESPGSWGGHVTSASEGFVGLTIALRPA